MLTGATGSLGAHILHQLLQNSTDEVSRVFCLVRTSKEETAHSRVMKAFKDRRLCTDLISNNLERICFLSFDLSQDHLGLKDDEIGAITSSNRLVIIHAAWTVDFLKPLPSFVKENLAGAYLVCVEEVSFSVLLCFFPSRILSVLASKS